MYNYILSHHRASGGEHNVLLDVGCGPGIVARDLAGEFDTVIGVDSGREMINAAERLGGVTRSGKEIKYFVGEAERIEKIPETEESLLPVQAGETGGNEGHVDLVTAGTAVGFVVIFLSFFLVAQILIAMG